MKLSNFLILMGLLLGLAYNESVLNAHDVKQSPYPFVCQSNDLLGHIGFGSLGISTTSSSVFLTSNLGSGYQFELKPNAPQITTALQQTLNTSCQAGLIECQSPFGNPVACTYSCATSKSSSKSPYLENPVIVGKLEGVNECLSANGTGVLDAIWTNTAGSSDYLNQLGTQTSSVNRVFIDSIVNNSTNDFIVATTAAPLYGQIESNNVLITDPSSLAGALDAGTVSIFNDIFTSKSVTLGGVPYPITFLNDATSNPDNRFTFYGTSDANTSQGKLSTKKHMANPLLSLNSVANSDIQTIILLPQTSLTQTCQPIIFIGRSASDNTFYALTYVGNYGSCCNTSGTPCKNDTRYNIVSAPALVSGQTGRLRLTINCIGGGYGVAGTLESLQGAWYPGQTDFGAPVTSACPS